MGAGAQEPSVSHYVHLPSRRDPHRLGSKDSGGVLKISSNDGDVKMSGSFDILCETCANYSYDDEDEEYYCDVQMDEDEFSRVMLSQRKACPFYRNGDEYEVVKHQAF